MQDFWRGVEVLTVDQLRDRVHAAGDQSLQIPPCRGYPYGLIVVMSEPCWAIPLRVSQSVWRFQGFFPSPAQCARWMQEWRETSQAWGHILDQVKGWDANGGGNQNPTLLGIRGNPTDCD